jgi:peptidoglycan/LPS O-acetylase OafA/YrhL
MEPTQKSAARVSPAHAAQNPLGIDAGKAWRREHGIPVVGVFDGFRALAILAIVVFHCLEVSGTTIALGGSGVGSSVVGPFAWALPLGVTALFIISGFVVYLPTVARGGEFGNVGHYALRRAARILPAYWVALVVAIILLLVVSAPLPDAGTFTSHVFMLQNWGRIAVDNYAIGFGVIPPVWTLSLEAAFYVLLPLIAGWWLRRPFIGLAISAAIMISWILVTDNIGSVASTLGIDLSSDVESRILAQNGRQFPVYAFAFGCGMTGAVVYIRMRARGVGRAMKATAGWVAIAGGASLLLFTYLTGHRAITDYEAYNSEVSIWLSLGQTASMAIFFVALSVAPRALQRPFSNGPIRWLGDISYGIYLIHFAVLWFVLEEFSLSVDGSVGAAAAWFAVIIPASVVYGYLSARFIERPLRRWAHRFGRRRDADPGVPRTVPQVSDPAAETR